MEGMERGHSEGNLIEKSYLHEEHSYKYSEHVLSLEIESNLSDFKSFP
jgi:hypothetical protein